MPKLLPLDTIQEVLQWYETNVCNKDLRDPRGFRVRFKVEHFVHLIMLTNRYGKEPKNRRAAIEDIRSGKIQFVEGRYNAQRAGELSWAVELVTTRIRPGAIVRRSATSSSNDILVMVRFRIVGGILDPHFECGPNNRLGRKP